VRRVGEGPMSQERFLVLFGGPSLLPRGAKRGFRVYPCVASAQGVVGFEELPILFLVCLSGPDVKPFRNGHFEHGLFMSVRPVGLVGTNAHLVVGLRSILAQRESAGLDRH
jgi:hypothetical protein